jgi:hypothetical protein
MIILMLDDGTPYGPFSSTISAVRADLLAMSTDSLPAYQGRATVLAALNHFDPVTWAQATALLEEVDHVVFSFELKIGARPDGSALNSFQDVFGTKLHAPADLIEEAKNWAANLADQQADQKFDRP